MRCRRLSINSVKIYNNIRSNKEYNIKFNNYNYNY